MITADAKPWLVAAGAGLLLGLLVAAVAFWLGQDEPELQQAVRDLAPLVPALPSAPGAVPAAPPPAVDEVALSLLAVDAEGRPISGVELWVGEHSGQTDLGGRLQLDLEPTDRAFLRARPPWSVRLPRQVRLSAGQQQLQVLVERTCGGPVEVLEAGQPFVGTVNIDMSGEQLGNASRRELPDDGVVQVPARPCGTFVVRAADPRGLPGRRFLRGEGVAHDNGLVSVDLADGAASARHVGQAPLRYVTVLLTCDQDCPDRLTCGSSMFLIGSPCEGGGDTWSCACPAGQVRIQGRWALTFPDWQEERLDLAVLDAQTDAVEVDLMAAPGEVAATWTGPLPCYGLARQDESGISEGAACDPEGRLHLSGLRPGAWTLRLSWGDSDTQSSHVRVVRPFELGEGQVLDLGTLSP